MLGSIEPGQEMGTLPELLAEISREFGIPEKILMSKMRGEWIMEVRKFASWFLRICGHTYKGIGKLIRFHHTTVIHHFETFPGSFLQMGRGNQDAALKLIDKWKKQSLASSTET
jgi:chromosomal replication initiation ATPase DnaA